MICFILVVFDNKNFAVINAFAKGNVPIECLRLVGSRFSGENFMTINTLKMLHLTIHNGSDH